MTKYQVMPERGPIETYYILKDAYDVADGMEASGDGPVMIFAETHLGHVKLR